MPLLTNEETARVLDLLREYKRSIEAEGRTVPLDLTLTIRDVERQYR